MEEPRQLDRDLAEGLKPRKIPLQVVDQARRELRKDAGNQLDLPGGNRANVRRADKVSKGELKALEINQARSRWVGFGDHADPVPRKLGH